MSTLPTDSQERKDIPVMRGVIDYFPDAIADVARLSLAGNQKHNPGEELHHARDKSTDHADCIIRHLIDRGTVDDDGVRHSTKVAWRALALAQEEIEADEGLPLPRGARFGPKAKHTTPHPEPDPNIEHDAMLRWRLEGEDSDNDMLDEAYPSSGFVVGDRVFILENHCCIAGILAEGSKGTVTEIQPAKTDLGDLLVVDFDNNCRDIGPVFAFRFELLEDAGSADNIKVGDIMRVIGADETVVYHIGDLVKVKGFTKSWIRVQGGCSEEQVFDPDQLEHYSPTQPRESRHPMAAEADRIMKTGDPMLIACEYAADEDMEAIVSGHTGLFDQGDPVVVWIDVNLGTQPLSADDADEFNSLVQDLKSFGQEA